MKGQPLSRHRAAALVAPLVLVQGVFLLSLATIVMYSFYKKGVYGTVDQHFALDNYARLLGDLSYLQIFSRSLVIAAANTALCVLIGYPTAYFIARSSPAVKAALLPLLILPVGTNFLIRAYAWIFILRTEGLLNSLMLSVGFQPLDLLFTRTSVVTGLLYNYLPFMILPIYASLHRFDFALIAAAKDLGATKFKAFKTVTLPLSVPGLMTGILLVFVPSFGEFVVPDLLGGAKNIMLGNLIKMQFLEARNWPFGAAITVVATATVFVIILMFRRLGADKSVIDV